MGKWHKFSYGAFGGCSNLKTVNFEAGSTIVCAALFMGCDGIEEIELPDTITEIGDSAFKSCKI